MADLGLPQLPAPVVAASKDNDEEEEKQQQPTSTAAAQQQQPALVTTTTTTTKLQSDDRDPLSHLEAVLGKFSSSLPNAPAVNEMLEALQKLHRTALDRIRCLEQQARTAAQASVVVPTKDQQEGEEHVTR